MAQQLSCTVLLEAENAEKMATWLMEPNQDDRIRTFDLTIENAYKLKQATGQANVIVVITAKTKELFETFVEFLKGLSEVTYCKGFASTV